MWEDLRGRESEAGGGEDHRSVLFVMKIVFFGETRHPNSTFWMDDLCSLFGLEVHAVDYEVPSLPNASIRQHLLPTRAPGRARYFLSAGSLRALINQIQPDLVLAQRVTSYGFVAARAGVRPLVLSAQSQNIVADDSPPGTRFCARYALRRADLIHAFADHMAEAMQRLGADPSRIRVLPTGVRTDIFRPGSDAERGLRILSSRQLRRFYRIDLLVKALAEVRALGVPAELWIAGEGPERPDLERLSRQLGCASAVRFLGRLAMEDLAAVYRQASVYASMAPTDGVSASLLEAMSSGLIPVVVDNGPNRLWIESGRNGLLVPAEDVHAMARALVEALSDGGVSSGTRERNRDLMIGKVDRKTNLGKMVEWWRELAERYEKEKLR